MNLIIPFEGKVKFDSPVKEICSISLEHEITKNDHEVLGNFLVSGTYREHELSINTQDFKYTVPFNVDLESRIDIDSLEFAIDNFTYELREDTLHLNIDYVLSADEIRNEDSADALSIDDPYAFLDIADPQIVDAKIASENDEPRDLIPTADKIEEKEIVSSEIEIIQPSVVTNIAADDDYIFYHVHVVKSEDTLASIANNYNITQEDILKLNDVEILTKGDKLLIPVSNE